MPADKAQKKLEDEIDRGKARIGMDGWSDRITTVFAEELFGLCSNCKNLAAAKTRYGRTRARCYELEVNLRGIDPVAECTAYAKRGQLSLEHMQSIATLIDLKRTVGFE